MPQDQCKYTFQFVHEIASNVVVACGTSAGDRKCYYIVNGVTRFSFVPGDLISYKPGDRPLTLVLSDENDGTSMEHGTPDGTEFMVAAISKDFESKTSFNLITVAINANQTARILGTQMPIKLTHKFNPDDSYDFLSLLNFGNDIVLVGTEGNPERSGIILHACKNDQGTPAGEFIFLEKKSLRCEHNGLIYKNLVRAKTIKGKGASFLVGVFQNDYQTESLICVYSQSQLIGSNTCDTIFGKSKSRSDFPEMAKKIGNTMYPIITAALHYDKKYLKDS